MTTLTIRGVDDATRHRIQTVAAQHGRSMEAELRQTIHQVYGQVSFGEALLAMSEKFRQETGGVDLDIPPRSMPRIPDLSGDEQ
jgi:plasmid stability protein